jgi:hypothetical protein
MSASSRRKITVEAQLSHAPKEMKATSFPLGEESFKPVPVDLWLGCLDVFEAAMQFRMPIRSPAEAFTGLGEQIGYVPANTPFNRGLLAVRDFTNNRDIFPAMMLRIMSFGKGIEAAQIDPRFGRYFLGEGSAEGTISIGGPLLAAFAVADLERDTLRFDLDSVFRIASEREVLDD